MILTTSNPPLTDDLVDRLLDIWVAATNAGGSVGFLAPVTREDLEGEVAGFWDQRLDGTLDLVVASEGPRVLGFGFLQPGKGLSAHMGEISKLQRDPAVPGRGVGGTLLEALEALAVDRGLTLVTLSVREGTGRERYYRERGYESVAVLPGWLRIGGRARGLRVMAKAVGADAGRSVHELAGPDGHPLPPGVAGAAPGGDDLRVAVRRLDPDRPLPAYARAGDAGLDLYARQRMVLPPGARGLMPTGLAVAIPQGHVGLVHPRSGLAIKRGLSIINTPGTIDAGYRGELLVPLINLDTSATIRLDRGDRIAQLLIQRVERAALVEVDELPDGVRGDGGFGSTGR
ncbi:MAG TPA: dUTP diphosphatase [Euzebya sp.]|nr:dUTP diphosphatase [Euzebya sp.]